MAPQTVFLCVLAALAALHSPSAGAAALRLDLRDPAWELTGADTVIEELGGRTALRLKTGSAVRRDVEFLDGTIELDLQVTGFRSFSFLAFRMASDEEYEEIYFRGHKSRLPDAIQYSPVYRGASQWQLYHDERATASAPFPPGEWIPIRVVVQGSRAAVFVGGAQQPRLVVPRLARDPKPGYLALSSFLPLGTPGDVYITSFANVVVRPGVVDYDFPEAPSVEPRAGRIARWQISPAFAPPEGMISELPAGLLAGEGWQTVAANPDGLVELERWVTRPGGVRRAAVLARLAIATPEAADRRLHLGFSDEVSVFLNGRLLVADDESYSFNLPRRQGLLTGDQLSVVLPLEPGDNELVLAIADRFGGWGLSGRLEDEVGLLVEPRAVGSSGAAVGSPAGESRPAAVAAESSEGQLAGLDWLAGCWRGDAGEECWLAPRDGVMLAVNRAPARDGKAPFFELLRVVEDEEGLVFLAQPRGVSPAVPFRAVELGERRVVFANPEHDFPQRITYWREGERLRVRVEALRDGKWAGFEQTWSPGSWPGVSR